VLVDLYRASKFSDLCTPWRYWLCTALMSILSPKGLVWAATVALTLNPRGAFMNHNMSALYPLQKQHILPSLHPIKRICHCLEPALISFAQAVYQIIQVQQNFIELMLPLRAICCAICINVSGQYSLWPPCKRDMLSARLSTTMNRCQMGSGGLILLFIMKLTLTWFDRAASFCTCYSSDYLYHRFQRAVITEVRIESCVRVQSMSSVKRTTVRPQERSSGACVLLCLSEDDPGIIEKARHRAQWSMTNGNTRYKIQQREWY